MPRNPELMRRNMREIALALEGADANLIENFLYSLFILRGDEKQALFLQRLAKATAAKDSRRTGIVFMQDHPGSGAKKREPPSGFFLDRLKEKADQNLHDRDQGDWGED